MHAFMRMRVLCVCVGGVEEDRGDWKLTEAGRWGPSWSMALCCREVEMPKMDEEADKTLGASPQGKVICAGQ
jgi:hypothetical protein